MKTSLFGDPESLAAEPTTPAGTSRLVSAAEFKHLMLSHRRMERLACGESRMRGLRDLDSGEVFLTDARRLLEARF
jgi:hypothetical protein